MSDEETLRRALREGAIGAEEIALGAELHDPAARVVAAEVLGRDLPPLALRARDWIARLARRGCGVRLSLAAAEASFARCRRDYYAWIGDDKAEETLSAARTYVAQRSPRSLERLRTALRGSRAALSELEFAWRENPGDFENLPDGDDPVAYAAHYRRLRTGMLAVRRSADVSVKGSAASPGLAVSAAHAAHVVLGSEALLCAVQAELRPFVYGLERLKTPADGWA